MQKLTPTESPRRPAADPLPAPSVPWTERYLKSAAPSTRLEVQFLWESIPRPGDAVAIRSYVQGLRLHRTLFRGGYTMLYPIRGRTLYRLARHAERDQVPGALVDCGTYNGGSTALLSAGAPRRPIWAFDSFDGLPPPSERDTNDPNADFEAAADFFRQQCVGSEERLREAVDLYGAGALLQVRPGWFADTLPLAREEIGPIAVLHIDGDWYDSVYTVLENLYELVVSGGAIVIDDYAAVPGAGRAADDFRRAVGDSAPLVRADYTAKYWRKP